MKTRLPTGLYVLTPDTFDDDWLVMAVSAAIRGGASAVQYRNKSVDAAQRLRQAQRLARACREGGALFIVNDSVELARAVGADGLHIGRDDGDPLAIRAALEPGWVLGVSCYDSFERALAVRGVADYVAFGSVYVSS
ncbi:MAG TPA: thiamine phosphate synthase, partial [Burkholderiaceae bacterium]|nr:thiamine phosphate synthase [Burkholderiaceae bacterium]